MTNWLKESEKTWWHSFCCNVLKAGPVPRHVAFIMDGNRRYARRTGLNRVLEGHVAGFSTLTNVGGAGELSYLSAVRANLHECEMLDRKQTLEWCRDLGITEVTVYAFSIENFRRSQNEVDELLELAREKLQGLLDERDKVDKHQVCIRFYGNMSLLPKSLIRLMARIMLMSRGYARHKLNVCIGYTGTDEISRAVSLASDAVVSGEIDESFSSVSPSLLCQCLDSGSGRHPDLLIRTSGEQRFSDFLLWQTNDSCLYFTDVMWPEFTFWNLCSAILHYQVHCVKNLNRTGPTKLLRREGDTVISSYHDNHNDNREDGQQTDDVDEFLDQLFDKRWSYLLELSEEVD